MLKRKSPLAAIGLATGAIVLQPVLPALQKFIQALPTLQKLNQTLNVAALNSAPLQTYWLTLQPTVQKAFENGYSQLAIVNAWSYFVILAAVILEGPIATLLGGVWASTGRVNVWAVLLVATVAGIIADSFWYYMGHFGREKMLVRWGHYLKIDMEKISKMESVLFGSNGGRVLFSSKLTSALIIPTLVAAGITNMGWRKVMRSMIVAQIIWSAALTTVGFVAADSFALISHKVENFGWIVGGGVALLLIGRVVYRWRKNSAE